MEQNITSSGSVATAGNTGLIIWSESGSVSEGPTYAIDYLSTATAGWNYLAKQNFTYTDTFGKNYSDISVTSYARLPKENEIRANGLCQATAGTCPLWLSNFLTQDANVTGGTNVSGVNGYWLMDSSTNGTNVFNVYQTGLAGGSAPATTAYRGVRPVITVYKNSME